MSMEQLIEDIVLKEEVGWGRDRLLPMIEFIKARFTEYGEALGLNPLELLSGAEKRRNYSAINYYQEANFPTINRVHIFSNAAEAREAFGKEGFRCPACDGVSKDPYVCDTGIKKDTKSGVCDWKAFGFFGCLGKGFTLTLRDQFADGARIETIFMPVALENRYEQQ